MESHSSRTVVSTFAEEEVTRSGNIPLDRRSNSAGRLNPHLALLALRVAAGGVGVSAAVPVALPAPPPLPGRHLVQVVHAAGRLDEEGGVGAAVAVAVVAHAAVVREGAGRLAVESVAVAGLPCGGPRAGSWEEQKTQITDLLWIIDIFSLSLRLSSATETCVKLS